MSLAPAEPEFPSLTQLSGVMEGETMWPEKPFPATLKGLHCPDSPSEPLILGRRARHTDLKLNSLSLSHTHTNRTLGPQAKTFPMHLYTLHLP